MSDSKGLDAKITTLLKFFDEVNSITFTGESYFIPKNEETILGKYGIPFEPLGESLQIQIKKFFSPTLVKYAPILNSEIKPDDINNEFLVVDAVKKTIIKVTRNSELSIFGNKDTNLLLYIRNILAYYRLYNFLKDKEFGDYHNDADNQIVIYSSAKGIYRITYETIPTIEQIEDISAKVDEMIKYANPLEIRPFFKSAIFTITNSIGIIPINKILEKSLEITLEARRDYDLVLKKFDFETFKNSLYKEKERYFTNIREIISKIFGQAVGIPVSISAAVFATYKVSDDTLMLLLVMLSFMIYVFFYVKIQLIYKKDIKEIENDFNNDFSIIISLSGLPPEIVQKEKQKIENKISSTIKMLHYLISTVIFLGILVGLYILYEIAISETFCFIRTIMDSF